MTWLSVARMSERGGRQRNEDATGFSVIEDLGCFVLADGAGGYSGGEVASDVVVNQVVAYFLANPRADAELAREVLSVAQASLADARQAYPQYPEMNTTITSLILDGEQRLAWWSYIGDSRIYLFRNGSSRPLTTDHSILQSMKDAGFFSGELRGNPKRSMLYAAVGSEDLPQKVGNEEPFAIENGDAFLLCTDGFWESVEEPDMEASLQQAKTPAEWLDGMVARIAQPAAAGQDNFSALAVWVNGGA